MAGNGRAWRWICFATMMGLSTFAMAEAPTDLRGDIGGLWFDSARDGQGLQIDLLDGQRAAVTWYTFDSEGRPLWLFGLGDASGNQMNVSLSRAAGGRLPTLAVNPAATFSTAGSLTITFKSCDAAKLSWVPVGTELPQGEFDVQRLTQVEGGRCNRSESFAEVRTFSFEHGANGFNAIFADLPETGHDIYQLDFAAESLPAPLNARRGLRLTGMNRSDDLAMLIAAPIAGLQPNQRYAAELAMEIASDVPRGCAGVGGSPGDSVYMKLGLVDHAPDVIVQNEGVDRWLRLNFDFGVQSQSGSEAVAVGDLANRQNCSTDVPVWQLKRLDTLGRALAATSDAQGRLWLVAGSDSAFEGLTSYYVTALEVRLRPLP